MHVTAIRASWLRARIPADRAHTSHFGRNDTFNTCLIEIETDTGLIGLGEAKVAVGNLGNYAALVTLVHELTNEPVELVDGYVLAPTRPGLGLTLRHDFVREVTVVV